MASGNQVPGHTPKWLRHHRRVSKQEIRKETATIDERTRSIDVRVRRLSDSLAKVQDGISEVKNESATERLQLRSRLNGIAINIVQETQATLELFSQLRTLRAPMPSTGGWAMDASSMLALLRLLQRVRPELVIECGSGSSTVWMAYVLEELGSGRIISLEHDPEYAEQTRAGLQLHELDTWATVLDAPLVPFENLPGAPVWYDVSSLPEGLPSIDVLLVDGPPAQVGKNARYPALPVMERRLADSAAIVLDDTGRPDEQAIVERWTREFPGFTLARVQPARAALAAWCRTTADRGTS